MSVRVLVVRCQRCGEDHELDFRPLSNPADAFAYWALCPVLHEPVLMAVEENAEG